jgi:predicted MFS family arabinose efflux permease
MRVSRPTGRNSLVIVSNLIVAFAPNLTVLLAGRILLGISIGGFWSFAVSLGLRLVHTASAERATAVILTGISLGTVCGVPAGAMIGDAFGWRMAFILTALLSAVVLAVQITCLPKLPALKVVRVADLLALFRIGKARLGLVTVALVITGHFAAYTYLGPLLEQIARLDPATITLVLVAYGVTGIAGNFLGGMLVARNVRAGLLTTTLMLGLALIATAAFGHLPAATIVLVAFWGLAFGAVPISVQTWMFKAAPDALESGSALLVSTFQVSIASGALFGGLIVDGIGVSGAMLVGGALALLAAGVVVLFLGEPRGEPAVAVAPL